MNDTEKAIVRPQLIPSSSGELRTEPSSYRDRDAKIIYFQDRIIRLLRNESSRDWEALAQSSCFQNFLKTGMVVGTRTADISDIGLQNVGSEVWTAALEHDRIPFISYPYEWCFGMLQRAAMLHLDILVEALPEGFILKDSSAFNVQWLGVQPTFIDVSSFSRLKPGEPWVGYRQFCEMFLFPLLLESYRGVPLRTFLRGNLEGMTAELCWKCCSFRDLFRPGVFKHVYLHRLLQSSFENSNSSVKGDLKAAGFQKSIIAANIGGLRKLISRLRSRLQDSAWLKYGDAPPSYSEADYAKKVSFVTKIASQRNRSLVWDLGCNTGNFARIVSKNSSYVVASDSDPVAVQRLYTELEECGPSNILPLVLNVSDPSPAQGWHGEERRAFTERGKPELTLALALVHHLVIGSYIEVHSLIDWFAEVTEELVVEFVSKDDPLVSKLMLNREDIFDDYTRENFEALLSRSFKIVEQCELNRGKRILYYCTTVGP